MTKDDKSIEFIHGNKTFDDDLSSQLKESPTKTEENGLTKDETAAKNKGGKKMKIVVNSKDLNKKKMGAFAGIFKSKAKKNDKKNEEKETKKLKDEEIKDNQERKRFIDAGVFDADGYFS